jgi:inorganic pyrophosphatase
MNLNAVSIGKNPPHDVNVVIEVPIGGEPIKYEMDKESGALQVDRFLYTSMRYPGNYGFIPHTLSDDGDPCDVIVANTRSFPARSCDRRVVGVLVMEDEAGGDEKAARRAVGQAHPALRPHPQLRRPALDHAAADRTFLRPL